jgi:FtsP/CotA-like multicopper oxidase with cupredoxin domain
VFPASVGERIRVRMVDVANAGYLDLRWVELRQIGSDQGLLPDLQQVESVVLAPSDRIDAEWLIAHDFSVFADPWSLLGAPAVGNEVRLFEVTVDAPGEPPEPLEFPFDGSEPTEDPGFTDILYVFHGDPHTGKWTINGELFPDITMEMLALDQWSVIELRNISQSAHPFHLHGHAFEVLTVDGVPPEFRTFEDTFDVAPYSVVRLGLLPNNPGEWMAHCHILPHAEGGMMTMLMVE